MRGTGALLPARNKLSQIYPVAGSWGKVATSTPKKQGDDSSEGRQIVREKAKPAVALSRPPPIPPVIGPLIALSLLETWSSRDGDDD